MAEFDFIIVGAGIGGLVLASRLTEDANYNVLLLEAGPDRIGDPRIDTPALFPALYGDREVDWDYMTEPQVHANNRQLGQPRGRMVGGSTAMNFTAIMYPSRSNFMAWKQLGNEGWGPEEMAPYLRKFHTYTPPSQTTAALLSLDDYMKTEHQGADGPIPVTMPDVYGEFNEAWEKAFGQLGWTRSADPIDGEKQGAFTCPVTVDDKGRRGYARAYYTPEVAQRPNLQLWPDTLVEKVLFDQTGEKPRATGVQIRTKDGIQQLSARREVIVSGGSLNSPQLLELSGIGRADLLQGHGIPVVLDHPGVGENLQDHSLVATSFQVADGRPTADVFRDPDVVQAMLKLHQETNSGPMSGVPMSMAYLPCIDGSGKMSPESVQDLLDQHLGQDIPPALQRQYDELRNELLNGKTPSAQYMYLPTQVHMNPGTTTTAQALAKTLPDNYITILTLHNHPFSRGSIHIRSPSVDEKPVYDPNLLSHPLDLEFLARQTQYIDRIVETEPLASLLKSDGRVPPHTVDLGNLDTAKDLVKERLYTTFHPVGTCAMLPADLGGVVDNRLKVYGANNLRVIDASIFPLQTTGNIQAMVYAMAEKAADIIKADHKGV